MLGLLIVAVILGGIVAAVTGMGFLFWVVSIALFVCGLPFALINGFIQDKIDYVQDREDYRQLMSDLREDERREDERLERELDRLERKGKKDKPNIYIDNRQVNIYGKPDDIEKIIGRRKNS
jgi:cell division protein FtsB